MSSSLTIRIKDPTLVEDLEALAEMAETPMDEFVSQILKIAITAAAERGKRKEKTKAKRG